MNLFAIGFGGAGSAIIGELSNEEEMVKEAGIGLNFGYCVIDFPKGIEKLEWEPAHGKRITMEKPDEKWVMKNFEGFQKEDIPSDPELGTGRKRCYSKAAFEFNKRRIEGALYDLLNDFFDRTRATNIACWLFTSFGGGSGSGMFIDVAILIDKMRDEFKLAGKEISLYLVGILPSAAKKGDDALSPPNAIQAFKEIDYLISGKSKEEHDIKNPFDQIFVVGLYKMMGAFERAKLMIDKMVAKAIVEFCYGIKDLNDMMSVIKQKKAGLSDEKFLSFTIGHYNFPMNEILELYQRENELLDQREKEAELEDEIKKLEKEMEEKDKRLTFLNGEVDALRGKIVQAKKERGIVNEKLRIPRWEKAIKGYEKEIKNEKDLKKPFEREKETKDLALGKIKDKIEKLRGNVAELKVKLEKKEEEFFAKESINSEEYYKIKEKIEEMKQRSLKELVEYVKGKGSFNRKLVERMEYLRKSEPLIIDISEGEAIPLLELGYSAPEGSIDEGILKSPAIVKNMEKREVLLKQKYEVNLYGIFAGINPKMINDLKIFVKDYQDSSPETINKTLAAFLWGEKEWSEYNPGWLAGAKKN